MDVLNALDNSWNSNFYLLHILPKSFKKYLLEKKVWLKYPIHSSFFIFSFLKILFIYSWEIQRERQRHRQREKQDPCGDFISGPQYHDLSQGQCSSTEPPSAPCTETLDHSYRAWHFFETHFTHNMKFSWTFEKYEHGMSTFRRLHSWYKVHKNTEN